MIKQIILLSTLFILGADIGIGFSQSFQYVTNHELGPHEPYGSYNPMAPIELKDFEPLIGTHQCLSLQRNPDGSWPDTTQMIWEFRYIFNGKAIQDMTWKQNGNHSSSIRQFNQSDSLWYVTFFSSKNANPSPPTWKGKRIQDRIVLKRPQQSPNGNSGINRLTFYNIRRDSFKWIGEWVSKDGSITYPFWKISCQKETL